MIRSESEYQQALRRLEQDRQVADAQRRALESAGLRPDEVEHAMQPLLAYQAELVEDMRWYEEARRRNFPAVHRLTDIGILLIALRIGQGWTQADLAERLAVSEAAVSRDERSEYHGISVERAQRILDALSARVQVTVGEGIAVPVSVARELEPV